MSVDALSPNLGHQTPAHHDVKLLHVAETVRGGIATYMRELNPLQQALFGDGNVRYVIPEDHIVDVKEIDPAVISPFRRSGRDLQSLARLWLTTEQVSSWFKPDIIHVHSTFAGVTTRLLPRLASRNAKIVYCPHGWAFARESSALLGRTTAWVERLLQRRADMIVCISANERRLALKAGLKPGNLHVVLSGIAPTPKPVEVSTRSWEGSRTKVVFVGRFDKQKGFDLLIEAARQLQDEVDVRMIGSEVVGRKTEMHLPPNVTTLGWQSSAEIDAQLALADLLVVPSRWEAFGLVVLEGMRAAKPVVAFKVGAMEELVDPVSTGLLCEPIGVEALVEALRRACTLDLPQMGERGRARFLDRFTNLRMHHELARLYSVVVQSGAASYTRNMQG